MFLNCSKWADQDFQPHHLHGFKFYLKTTNYANYLYMCHLLPQNVCAERESLSCKIISQLGSISMATWAVFHIMKIKQQAIDHIIRMQSNVFIE